MKALKISLFLCLVIGTLSSCKKDLLDINVDPNRPTTASASPELIMTTALNTTATIYNTPTNGNNYFVWAGIWMGHISYSGNYAIATENISYNLTNTFGQDAWTYLYDNNEDYDFLEKKGTETGNTFYRAVGILMKSYNFQTLVDLYGNVPYTEALQGTAKSTPKYDNGKTIYEDLAKRMDTAIALFKVSANMATAGDIMFKGDVTKWTKFANTVKLRLLLRQSQVNEAAAKTQAAALTGGFLTTNATVNPNYSNNPSKMNPFWGSNVNISGTYTQTLYRAGGYAVDFYKSNNDPRLQQFFSPNVAGDYKGNYFGDQGEQNSKISGIGPGVLKAPEQDAVIMLAAESYFLQAEAVLRGWITINGETAQSLYEKGVTASFTFLGLSASDAAAYYSQAGNKQTTWSATSGFQEQLALIIRQKWAAETWINELEPYNDYRRLHLPADIPLSTSPFSTGIFPARLLYPQTELNVNGESVAAQGNVTPGTKVWWMP